jgi:hypothetical protein
VRLRMRRITKRSKRAIYRFIPEFNGQGPEIIRRN